MFMREKRRGEYIYAFICEFINDKKINVLEFGCGSGGILDTLKNKTKSEVIGIDLDKQAVSFGKQKGINLLSVDLDNLKDNKFDLIIASHVMEHLDNPQVTLGKLAELLNDGGYIYIEVPGVENKKVIEYCKENGIEDLQKFPAKFFKDNKSYAPGYHKIIQDAHKNNKSWFSSDLKDIFSELEFPFFFMDFHYLATTNSDI